MFHSFSIFSKHKAFKSHKKNIFKDQRYKFSI